MLLTFHNHNYTYNHPYNFYQKYFLLLQSTFTSLFHPYVLLKSSLQSALTLPSSTLQQFFISLFLRTTIPTIYKKKSSLHQPFSQFRLRQSTKELWSLVRNDTILTSPFFLKITKLVYCRKLVLGAVSDEDVCNWNGKPSNPPSLIPSNYCHYFHTLLIPPQELTFRNLFKLIFILSLTFSYSTHDAFHP